MAKTLGRRVFAPTKFTDLWFLRGLSATFDRVNTILN